MDVKVWAFTEGFLVAESGLLPWQAVEPLALLGEQLTLDDVADAYHRPMLLETDGLEQIEVGSRRPRGRQWVLGVDHVIFDYVDGGEFDLMVLKKRTDDLMPVLREVFPGKVRDRRKDRRR